MQPAQRSTMNEGTRMDYLHQITMAALRSTEYDTPDLTSRLDAARQKLLLGQETSGLDELLAEESALRKNYIRELAVA